MKKSGFLYLIVTLLLVTSSFVAADTISVPDDYSTIEGAVGVAVDGDVINVAAGTYTPGSTIIVSENITINGAGSDSTIVQFNFGGGSGYGLSVSADNIVLSGLTLQGNGASGPRYGLHVSGAAYTDAPGGSLTDIEVLGFHRTGLDLNGVDGITISQCYAHDNGGAGIALCDGKNVAFSNNSTADNAWGGVAIYSWGQYHTPGAFGITFAGTNSHPDAFYIEEGNFSDPNNPIAISFSASAGDGAAVTLQLTDFLYFVTGESDNDNDYHYFFADLATAMAVAALDPSPFHMASGVHVVGLADGVIYLGIQGAIDAAAVGDTINIAAGTYEEQLHITTADLTITGAGSGDNPAVDTIVLSPASLTWFYTTSDDNYPIVGIDGVTGVEIASLRVDGDGRGNANYRFQGIGFWNAGGEVTDVDVVGVVDTPFSGAQHGVGVYAYNNTDGPYTVNLTNVDVVDYQKGAIALNGVGLTANVVNCTTTGIGATGVTAQNGIQMYGGNGGTISGCTVTGNIYTGTSWAASGLLLISAGTVAITDTDVTDGNPCVYCQDTNASADGLEITNNDVDSGNGFYVRVQSGIVPLKRGEMETPLDPSPFGDYNGDGRNGRGTATVTLTNSTMSGQATGYGVCASNFVATDTIDLTVTNCTVKNWGWGFVMFGSGGEVATHVSDNGIFDNDGFFYAADVLTTTQDASGNYWGYTEADTLAGDAIYGDIDYSPWLGGGLEGAPGFSGDFSELYVDDDSPVAGAIAPLQEGIDLVDGSTLYLAPGTYTEAVNVNKTVDIIGSGPAATILSPVGTTPVLTISADNVSVSQLEITDPIQLVEGIRVSGATTGLTLDQVFFTNLGNNPGPGNAFGVNFLNSFTALDVIDCEFIATNLGVPSRAIGVFAGNNYLLSDFDVSGSTFEYLFVGIYLRSDIDGLTVTGNTFGPFEIEDCTAAVAGIYIGDGSQGNFDVQNLTVTGNDFVNYGRGVYIWNYSHGDFIGSVDISDNTFTNTIWSSPIRFIGKLDPVTQVATIEGPITIDNNTFVQNVDIGGGGGVAMIDFRGGGESLTSQIAVTNNEFNFTGPFVSATYGIKFRGPITNATISGNALYGNGAGGATGGPPNTTGILVGTDDSWLGPLSSSAVLNIANNVIDGFENGVAVYDGNAAAFGNLPIGAVLSLTNNAIVNNTMAVNTGPGELTLATPNWWGDVTGPNHAALNPGGLGNPVTDNVLFDPWIGKAGSENIVCATNPLILTNTAPSGVVAVNYLGGASDLTRAFNITVTWDDAEVAMTGITPGDLFPVGNQFEVYGSGNSRTVSWAMLGLPGDIDPVTGPGTMFNITFEALGGGCDNATDPDIAFSDILFRNRNGQPLSGLYAADGDIVTDTQLPVISGIVYDNSLPHAEAFIKTGDTPTLEAIFTDTCVDFADLTLTCDFSTLVTVGGYGAVAPTSSDPGAGSALWNVPSGNLAGDGTYSVTLTAVDPVGNTTTADLHITIDNTAPGAITGFAAEPDHNQVDMAWNDPSGLDANLYTIELQRNGWGGAAYPTYPAGDVPVYPVPSVTSGVLVAGVPTGATMAFSELFAVSGMERNIYYYTAVVVDKALNYGPGGLAQAGSFDRATNYWLGDVRPGGTPIGNGVVYTADMSALSSCYGLFAADPDFEDHCDVGPTDDYYRTGIPQPDSRINFEDLMIFSMNYDPVSPTGRQQPLVALDGFADLTLEIPADISTDSPFSVKLHLNNEAAVVKGIHLKVNYETSQVTFLGASAGELLAGETNGFFKAIADDGSIDISAALLGPLVTFPGSGEVATLTFTVTSGGSVAMSLSELELRNGLNEELYSGASAVDYDPEVQTLPTRLFMSNAAPNPFARATTICFGLPTEEMVEMAIYDLSGRLVRTLVDGMLPAGEHAVVWDRRTDNGAPAASGVYFTRFTTGSEAITRKIVISD